MEELQKRQEKIDAQADEEHELNMELLEAQIEQTKNSAVMGGFGGSSASAVGGEGYTPLEQRRHEKTRGTQARMEGLQKAAAKKA
jgi:transcriptional accessory protein Tex/SPT6